MLMFNELDKNSAKKDQKKSKRFSTLKAVDEKAEDGGEKQESSRKINEQNHINESDVNTMRINLGRKSMDKGDRTEMTLDHLETAQAQEINFEDYSTQKKNIFYHSFKNIRDRYQYKEQRVNKIQMRNEKICKQILPDIKGDTKNSLSIKKMIK